MPAAAEDASDAPRRERTLALAVVLLAAMAAAALIVLLWKPAPPSVVVISTGATDGAYYAYGERYRSLLARAGIRLQVESSAGSVQNLQRLKSGEGGVSLALMQGGIPQPADGEHLVSLGGMFLEPLWVFHRRSLTVGELTALAGRRVAIGPPGSGTRQLAETLLGAVLPAGAAVEKVALGGVAAAEALQRGEVDAAFFVFAPDAPAVQRLLRDPQIALLDFQRAQAYSRRFPFLTPIELPRGAIDLAADIPATDIKLVAATASLVARADIHPVIVDRVLAAARQVHGGGSALWRPGSFPSPQAADLPLSGDAERFYKSGPSMLQRWLPFWAVVWIQRLVFFGLPIVAVGLPLLRYMPGLYRWSMRRRIYRWYGELSFIERALQRSEGARDEHRRKLGDIERRINGMHIPAAYASEAYTLKMHLRMVREQLAQQLPDGAKA